MIPLRHLTGIRLAMALFVVAATTIFLPSPGRLSEMNNLIKQYEQEILWVPTPSNGGSSRTYLLETAVYRPTGPGPFPLVTINHGKPPPGTDLRGTRPIAMAATQWFLEHGFAVAIPLRRGYGRSEGEAADIVGYCDDLNYFATARQTAFELGAVIAFLQKQSFVDPTQVIAVGHSHGAFGLLGLAYDPPRGLVGIINFAGGTGDWAPRGLLDYFWHRAAICGGADKLVEANARLGKRNKIPQLWLYSENDSSFGPSLAHAMFEAYSTGSEASVSFVALPPWGWHKGHSLFADGEVSIWAPAVSRFLANLHITGYRP